jgi:NAD(P)H-dependent flavin oxidoreductase YrpB (nitropropane dioxygenase family)
VTAVLNTPLCQSLGIELPIFNAGMGGGVAGAALAAAVSNAGGLGVLGMGGCPAPLIREQIKKLRSLTNKPFGVNIILALLEEGQVESCLDEKVPLMILFWGDAKPFVEKAHRVGTKVILQVGSVDEAKAAADAGVDAVMIQGVESGGHVKGKTGLSIVLPAVVEAVKPLPVVAAGGVADGRSLAAALAAGAQACSIGTRFLCSTESAAARAYKERITRASAEDTVHTLLFDVGWPNAAHRVLRNKAYADWEAAGSPETGKRPGENVPFGKMPFAGTTIEMPRYHIFMPLEGFEGDMEYAALYCGQSASLVNDIKPAAEIVRDLVAGAQNALQNSAS